MCVCCSSRHFKCFSMQLNRHRLTTVSVLLIFRVGIWSLKVLWQCDIWTDIGVSKLWINLGFPADRLFNDIRSTIQHSGRPRLSITADDDTKISVFSEVTIATTLLVLVVLMTQLAVSR